MGTRRSDRVPMPSSSTALVSDECASAEQYTVRRRGAPASPGTARRRARQPLAAHVEPRLGVARHGQRDQVRGGAPAREQPAGLERVPEQLLAPVQHLQLDVVVAHVGVDAAHRVRRRGQHLGDHPHRRAAAQHPAPEPGVAVAELVGPHVLEPLGVDLLHGLRPRRRRPVEVRLHVRRRVLPRGALAQRLHVVHGVVHGAVRERAQLRPVLGVEGLLPNLGVERSGSLRASWRSSCGRGGPGDSIAPAPRACRAAEEVTRRTLCWRRDIGSTSRRDRVTKPAGCLYIVSTSSEDPARHTLPAVAALPAGELGAIS